jgi:hypothetical protein
MYQQALQGYEKSLGLENVARHRSELNTISNLVDLFAAQGRLDEVNEMYWLSGNLPVLNAGSRAQTRLSVAEYKSLRIHVEVVPIDSTKRMEELFHDVP